MVYRRGVTCQITAFEVPNPPLDPEATGRKWMAVATAHAYDPNVVVPRLSAAEVVATGEAMRVLSGRAFADTESAAMIAALEGLLFDLTARGYSANHDVKLW